MLSPVRLGLVGVVAASVIVLPAGSAAAADAFTPVADSYVDASAPNSNSGNQTSIRVDADPVRVAYLRFDVRGTTSPTSALLKVYAESSSSVGVQAHAVANNSWGENSITYNNAPAVGALLDSTGAFPAGSWISLDVSGAVTGDGFVSFALTTTSATAIRITSREGVNKPQLIVPAPPAPSPYVVSRVGDSYLAVSQTTGTTFTGTLKSVVENAVADMEVTGGGTVQFTEGTFDFGTEYFKFFDLADITFVGAGIDATIIRNSTSAAEDTEPFNFTGADRIVVRDLTVSAGGPVRTTSDALDFDRGNDVLVERVKVIASRGRGIVFDGKNDSWTSLRNTVRDCVITGTDGDGIELLASSQNTITGCTITDVGGHGIQVNKSSPLADQPNKKSSDNLISNNTIDQAGQDGVNVSSGDRNTITGNTITNSSDDTTGRDGIRITSIDTITCDDNTVSYNVSTDNQATKTQKYGLDITSAACNRTIVGPGNSLSGNLLADIHDAGTATIYQ
jgi:parallel beta-helix repeat protein